MSKVFAFNMVTLDGYFEGPNHDISWHNVDQEFGEFAIAQLREIGTLVFGRVTYEMMASYWPSPAGLADDPIVAGLMNEMPKIVASTTLREAEWQHSRLVGRDISSEIRNLKRAPGKDIAVLGSAALLKALIADALIDEHRLMLNPVVLGTGTPLFQSPAHKVDLTLVRSRTFRNGNVLLCYEPRR